MVSYSSWNGVKMHANHAMVTNFLKKTLRFRGFVISGWEGIDRIILHLILTIHILFKLQSLLALTWMVPYNYTELIDGLTNLVRNNVIPMSRIDDAVKRILRVEFVMGLFENPLAAESLVDHLGSQVSRLTRNTGNWLGKLVLLKNGESADAPLLPLPKKASNILVAGSHADNLGYQCGGWTIKWQQPYKWYYNPHCSQEHSEHPYAETKGDSLNLTIPDPGPSTITNVCGTVKCVVIVVSGRPVVIQPYVASIDALFAAWQTGSEGQGVADVMLITWVKTVDQLPMTVGDPHYDPLFPFGFGLTTKPTKAYEAIFSRGFLLSSSLKPYSITFIT
ncbi:hypothetical protein CRYUN_Cryun08bG0042400 [Craigia yunnanensis]